MTARTAVGTAERIDQFGFVLLCLHHITATSTIVASFKFPFLLLFLPSVDAAVNGSHAMYITAQTTPQEPNSTDSPTNSSATTPPERVDTGAVRTMLIVGYFLLVFVFLCFIVWCLCLVSCCAWLCAYCYEFSVSVPSNSEENLAANQLGWTEVTTTNTTNIFASHED